MDLRATAPSRERQRPGSATYLITFTCYGTRLHGQEGTIDRRHNQPGSRAMPEDWVLLEQSRGLMSQQPYLLDAARRKAALDGIRWVCDRRGWTLVAAHVRTNHVHVIVYAPSSPENVMIALKAYASRAINELAIDPAETRRWTRHGSTRYLWTHTELRAAIKYVVAGQGEPMEVYRCAS